jgi:hypothetical protein
MGTTMQDYDAWLDEAAKQSEAEEIMLREMNAKIDVERVKYTQLFPNHCKTCEGWGGKSGREFRGMYGMSAAYEDTFDTCSACANQLMCPRCGIENALNEDGEGPCPSCKWNYDVEGMPQYASW